jgi:hypothetical protein
VIFPYIHITEHNLSNEPYALRFQMYSLTFVLEPYMPKKLSVPARSEALANSSLNVQKNQ